MNLRSKIVVGLCFAFALAFPAIADITYTQGSGTTIFDFTCFTTKHCSAHVPINSAGTEIGTSSNPIQVTVANTGANSTAVKVNVASGGIASGAIASGAVASGAVASGAYTSGSIASGAMVDLGAQADSAAAGDTSTASLIALVKRTNQNLTTLNTTAGTAATLQAATTGGTSTTGNIAANNTTAVVVKASAGTLYGVQLYGIGSAPAYLKIYNATSATCGSGTPIKRLMIPAASTAANGAGSNISFGDIGVAFGTGITYCVTTGITDADTTAPAASTFLVNLDWK